MGYNPLMLCPACHEKLTETGPDALICPQGHGALVTAKLLRGDAVGDDAKVQAAEAAQPGKDERAGGMACPHCGALMTETNYVGSGVMIDVCLACPYRWLDAGELKKIRARHAKNNMISPAGWAAISGLNMDEEHLAQTAGDRAIAEAQDEEAWTPLRLKEPRRMSRAFYGSPVAIISVAVALGCALVLFGFFAWTIMRAFPNANQAGQPSFQGPLEPFEPYRQPASDDKQDLLPWGLVFLAALIAYPVWRRWEHLQHAKADNDPRKPSKTSLILGMYSLGVHLQKMAGGTVAGHPYTFFVTSNMVLPPMAETGGAIAIGMARPLPVRALPEGAVPAPSGQAVMAISLPTSSRVHFAGFSLKDPVFRRLLGNTFQDDLMAQVELEGDFPSHFRLYCDKGFEIELLQVLDPDKMAFLVDFCKVCNWELVDDTLYFVQSTTAPDDPTSQTTLVEAAQEFAAKILPTLQEMSR